MALMPVPSTAGVASERAEGLLADVSRHPRNRHESRQAGILGAYAPSAQLGEVPAAPGHASPTSVGDDVGFIQNDGQQDAQVDFILQGAGHTASFTPQGVTLALTDGASRWAVKASFVGAHAVHAVGLGAPSTVVSYFTGSRDEWVTGVPAYSQIVYRDLWPGIDLVYSSENTGMKYEFRVAPGADPSLIRLSYDGVRSLGLTGTGDLLATTPAGNIVDEAPVSYQRLGGRRLHVASGYRLEGTTVSFALGDYNRARPLVIDPVVVLQSGYIGGEGVDQANAIDVDASGNAYITGMTQSTEATFPVHAGPDLTANDDGAGDAFVAKLTPSGEIAYLGYLGGLDYEIGWGIAADSSGAAYVAGMTFSDEGSFPVVGGLDGTFNGGTDGFVAKITPSGTDLAYSGYIGGESSDAVYSLAVDPAGNAYLVGDTSSSESTFPVRTGPDVTFNGESDAFVAKVTPSGGGLSYAGYIGGDTWEFGSAIAVDASGGVYVAGMAESTEATFPVVAGPDLTHNGSGDAFVSRVAPSGTGLTYSGFVGGASWDAAWALGLDAAGNAYLLGDTESAEDTFPVEVGPDTTYNGASDAFVAKVAPAGTDIGFAGYLGGSGDDYAGYGVAVDGGGNIHLAGITNSGASTFPVIGGPDLTENGLNDAYVAKLRPSGTGYVYLGYIGGSQYDSGFGIDVHSSGTAYVAGATNSTESSFPVAGGPDLTFNDIGVGDAFVTKIGIIHQLSVTKAGSGLGSVSSSPAGIICGGDCAEDYLEGTTVTLTATVSPDSRFGGWSGACSGTASTCQVSMDSPKTATATFIETIPPETTITSGPANKTRSTTAQFGFSSNESGSTFECSLEGGPFQACTSPKSYPSLGEGAHGFRVRATDGSGNTDPTPAQWSWAIDLTPPETTITSAPSGVVTSAQASFSFTSSESPAVFSCSLDGGTYSLCTTPASFSSLADGAHTFRVRAEDQVGNVDSTSAAATWVVDAQGPVLTFLRPGPGAYVNDQSFGGQGPTVVFGSVQVQVRAQDLESSVASFRFEVDGVPVDPTQVTVENGVYRFTYRPASQGQHTITAKSTNGSGIGSTSSIQVFGVPG